MEGVVRHEEEASFGGADRGRLLTQAELEMPVVDVIRQMGISEQTSQRWKNGAASRALPAWWHPDQGGPARCEGMFVLLRPFSAARSTRGRRPTLANDIRKPRKFTSAIQTFSARVGGELRSRPRTYQDLYLNLKASCGSLHGEYLSYLERRYFAAL